MISPNLPQGWSLHLTHAPVASVGVDGVTPVSRIRIETICFAFCVIDKTDFETRWLKSVIMKVVYE